VKLLPCPSCGRHVRIDETACPFCNQTVAFEWDASREVGFPPGLSRSALLLLGAMGLAGCGKDDAYAPIPTVYGMPPDYRPPPAVVPDDASIPMIEPVNVMDAGVQRVDAGKPDAGKARK
jgi:hypothetical protein